MPPAFKRRPLFRAAKPKAELRSIDARMVKGLPGSPEAIDWLEKTLAAMQVADPRPDVDLGSIEARLAALEARPEGAPPTDLTALWEALGALAKRTSAIESDLAAALARLAALEACSLEPQVQPPPAPPPNLDPLDPANWSDIGSAKAALLVLITREAALRCGHKVELYEKMVRLDMLGDLRSADEDLQLLQQTGWARERQLVELARLTHNAAIGTLESVEDAARYDWRAGWPELEIHDRGAAQHV